MGNQGPKSSPFWKKFIEGLELRPVDTTLIKGASGLEHNNYAIGIDEARKRLVFVSADRDPRAVVLIRGDIQAALPNFKVIGARVLDSNPAADILQFLQDPRNKQDLEDGSFKWLGRLLGGELKVEVWKRLVRLGVFSDSQIWTILEFYSKGFTKGWPHRIKGSDESQEEYQRRTVDSLKEYDPLRDDLKYGICPIPLYEFEESQLQSILNADNPQVVQEILLQRDILQYFLPPPDHLALGLIDSGLTTKHDLLTELKRTPNEGYPYGKTEIIEPSENVIEIIDKLQERKLLVEGESKYEITQKGIAVRNIVRFKPREGLISKIINRFKISIDLKNIFGIGKER